MAGRSGARQSVVVRQQAAACRTLVDIKGYRQMALFLGNLPLIMLRVAAKTSSAAAAAVEGRQARDDSVDRVEVTAPGLG